MKTLLCFAVACVGLAGFARAQDPAATPAPSTTTPHHRHHHRHHRHHHHRHHAGSSVAAPQKPAAENPTPAPQ